MKPSSASSYPKVLATVARRDRVWFTARADDGTELRVQIAYRSGKGHHDEVQPGVRVKLYQRPGEAFWRYRFLGG
jgi:hypothetical protein